jgi:hypothetical protein
MFDFSTIFWQFIALIEPVIFIIVFLILWFVIMPPIAKRMIGAKWKGGVPAFIQNDTGKVRFSLSSRQLPTGVIKYRGSFYFILKPLSADALKPKNNPNNKTNKPKISKKELKEKTELTENVLKMSQSELDKLSPLEFSKLESTLLHVPILDGLGKQVFFGYSGVPILSSLKTVAHASLPALKELIAKHRSVSPLMEAYNLGLEEGQALRGKDMTRLFIIVMLCIVPIAIVGLMVYLLTQGA